MNRLLYRPPRLERSIAPCVRMFWRQFRRHKGAVAGLIILTIIVFATVFGPILYPLDPFEINIDIANQGASLDHPMGTEQPRQRRDGPCPGGWPYFAVGRFAAMIFGVILGTAVGVISGFFRRLDGPMMRLTDLFLALPILPLLLVIIMLFREPLKDAFGPELASFILVVFVIGVNKLDADRPGCAWVTCWLSRNKSFVLAAHSIGTRQRKIMTRHIVPKRAQPVMVAAALGVAGGHSHRVCVVLPRTGFPADFPTWGRLLFDAKDYLQLSPMRVIWPGGDDLAHGDECELHW